MKTGEAIAQTTVRLFEAGDLCFPLNLYEARHIFASGPSNPLAVAGAMACGIFKLIRQKSVSRRMKQFYKDGA